MGSFVVLWLLSSPKREMAVIEETENEENSTTTESTDLPKLSTLSLLANFTNFEPAFFRELFGSWWDFMYGSLVVFTIFLMSNGSIDQSNTMIFMAAIYAGFFMILDSSTSAVIRIVRIGRNILALNIWSLCNNIIGLFADAICCMPYLVLWTAFEQEACNLYFNSISAVRISRLFSPSRIALQRDVREATYKKLREIDPNMDASCRANEEQSYLKFSQEWDQQQRYTRNRKAKIN